MNLPVSFYSIDQSRVAVIADISKTGCRLLGVGLPGVGQDVLLNAAETELFGQIIWKIDAERGVKFDQPITETELQELRKILGRNPLEPARIAPEGRRRPD